jgi:4-hydroxybenzoate polyprenyltransferase
VLSLPMGVQDFFKGAKIFLSLARYDRPVGIWLLFLPSVWGLTLAYEGLPPLSDLLLFFFGASLMRGAGCTFNDMVDAPLDRYVARTQSRPLASGTLTIIQAGAFLMIQLAFAGLVLLQLNTETIILGFVALALTLCYPWMKRLTYWPQLFLGLTFNWGILMGYTSVQPTNSVNYPVMLVYSAGILWTLAYDTIYAYQDAEDDAVIGIKSSALLIRHRAKLFLTSCYGAMFFLLLVTGVMLHLTWGYYGILAMAAAQVGWWVIQFKEESPDACKKFFYANQWVGVSVALAFLLGFFT